MHRVLELTAHAACAASVAAVAASVVKCVGRPRDLPSGMFLAAAPRQVAIGRVRQSPLRRVANRPMLPSEHLGFSLTDCLRNNIRRHPALARFLLDGWQRLVTHRPAPGGHS